MQLCYLYICFHVLVVIKVTTTSTTTNCEHTCVCVVCVCVCGGGGGGGEGGGCSKLMYWDPPQVADGIVKWILITGTSVLKGLVNDKSAATIGSGHGLTVSWRLVITGTYDDRHIWLFVNTE